MTNAIPFKFDMRGVMERLDRLGREVHQRGRKRLTGATVTLNLPFVNIKVEPKDREKKVARELLIRLLDRRVLSGRECCDGCIDKALASLQEIRQLLIEKQVELSDLHDGPLYLLMDAMALGIRQFLTFEQTLTDGEMYAARGS